MNLLVAFNLLVFKELLNAWPKELLNAWPKELLNVWPKELFVYVYIIAKSTLKVALCWFNTESLAPLQPL